MVASTPADDAEGGGGDGDTDVAMHEDDDDDDDDDGQTIFVPGIGHFKIQHGPSARAGPSAGPPVVALTEAAADEVGAESDDAPMSSELVLSKAELVEAVEEEDGIVKSEDGVCARYPFRGLVLPLSGATVPSGPRYICCVVRCCVVTAACVRVWRHTPQARQLRGICEVSFMAW